MGDRLISAEKLKNHYAWWDDEKKEIFDIIVDLQPTACDIDEIVEQLKVETVERITIFLESNDKERADLVYGCFRKAIEIVKKGGAE